MHPNELKSLKNQILEHEGKIAGYDLQIQTIRRMRDVSLNAIAKLKKEIEEKSEKEVIVSEHAILRFAERIMGLEPSKVEEQIKTPEILAAIKLAGGNGKFSLNDKFTIVVKNNIVTTIFER